MTSDLHHFSAFGQEQLLFDRERNTGSVAPHSRNQKRDPFTQEQREDDPKVEKRARLNKEKLLERPSEESGLISEGDVLIGEKNKLTVQRSVQFELQNHNGSNSMFGGALEIIVAELPRLIEQKQLQEAQIEELKEALDHAKAENREEKEASVAAEQKISALMEDCISLLNEKLQQEAQIKELKEALDHAKAENTEEMEARVAAEQKISALAEERISLLNEKQQQEAQIKELKEALDHAKAEIREEKEARVAAEQTISALTEERISLLNERPVLRVSLPNKKLGWEDQAKRWEKEKLDWMANTAQLTELKEQQLEAQIKRLKEALDHAEAEIREEKEARYAAELIRDLGEERISLLNEKVRKEKVHWTAKIKEWFGTYLTRQSIRLNTTRDCRVDYHSFVPSMEDFHVEYPLSAPARASVSLDSATLTLYFNLCSKIYF